MPIGLVGATRLGDVGRMNHQSVAYAYRRVTGGVDLEIYDNNTPRRSVILEWRRSQPGIRASNRQVPWRGFFLHSYDPIAPPLDLWDSS